MKRLQKSDWKSDHLWLGYDDWKSMCCWFLDWMCIHVLPSVFTSKCRLVIGIWRHYSPISCKHVFWWRLLFDPHWTTYHSNIGVLSYIMVKSTIQRLIVGVIWFSSHVRQLWPIRFTQQKKQISYEMSAKKLDWRLDHLWLSYDDWKCMFVDFLIGCIHVLPSVFTSECGVVIGIWRHSPISCEHVSWWCLLFDPHRTTYHSNIGVLSNINVKYTIQRLIVDAIWFGFHVLHLWPIRFTQQK